MQNIKINHIPDQLYNINFEKDKCYMATVAPGLEDVASDELKQKINLSKLIGKTRGKIFFCIDDELDYNILRCVDNIYMYIHIGTIGMTRNDLHVFRNSLMSQAFSRVMAIVRNIYGDQPHFYSNASKSGSHSFSRFEISAWFDEIINDNYHFKKIDPMSQANALEFRIDVIDNNFLLFIKLTDATFRFRGHDRVFSKAAIRPPIAHCLVWLSKPFDDEIFIDPFCGSGTILCEREVYPYNMLIGNDINKTELLNARTNLAHPIPTYNDDALMLNFDNDYFDTVVTNLPWGMQIEVDNALSLYNDFLRVYRNYLKQNGKFVILTSLEHVLSTAAVNNNLSCVKQTTISLHGTLCGVFILHK